MKYKNPPLSRCILSLGRVSALKSRADLRFKVKPRAQLTHGRYNNSAIILNFITRYSGRGENRKVHRKVNGAHFSRFVNYYAGAKGAKVTNGLHTHARSAVIPHDGTISSEPRRIAVA